jgi:cytochrome c-type biogenesis protein CcmE
MKKTHKRLLKLLTAFLSIGLGAYLFLSTFKEAMVFYYTPKDLASKAIAKNKIIRLGGVVRKGSHQRHANGGGAFILEKESHAISVTHTCLLPTLFKEGTMAVVEGTFDDRGTFKAREVLAKHDENYAPLPKTCLEEQGNQWS